MEDDPKQLRKLITQLLYIIDKNTCQHEETHRGGAIWTICDGCGMKWADDRGGFVPYIEPGVVTEARAALFKRPMQPSPALQFWKCM